MVEQNETLKQIQSFNQESPTKLLNNSNDNLKNKIKRIMKDKAMKEKKKYYKDTIEQLKDRIKKGKMPKKLMK